MLQPISTAPIILIIHFLQSGYTVISLPIQLNQIPKNTPLHQCPVDRPPVEIRCGRLVDCHGHDVDTCYRAGVSRTIAMLGNAPVDLAILQPRSPTCGVHQVYDGTFSGVRTEGQGILAQALAERGTPLREPEEL